MAAQIKEQDQQYEWANRVAQVLPLVLANCPAISKPETICNLLQVSTSIRKAVQQSTGHLELRLGVVTGEADSVAELRRWMGLAEWLPQHPGLVSSIVLVADHSNVLGEDDDHEDAVEQLAQQILAMSLRLCAANAATAAARQDAAAAARQDAAASTASLQQASAPRRGRRHRVRDPLVAAVVPPLQLCSCTIDGFAQLAPALLTELAWCGLRELDLSSSDVLLTPAVCAALGQMTSLQQLTISPVEWSEPLSIAVGQLSGLTQLKCDVLQTDAAVCLPPSLRHLSADSTALADDYDMLDLSHLTALVDLTFGSTEDGPAVHAVLPPQLTFLDAQGPLQAVEGLRDLQKIFLKVWDTSDLTVLGTLVQLPQLSAVDVYLKAIPMSKHALQQAAAAMGSANNLTCVSICGQCGEADAESEVDWCRLLSKLQNLEQLELYELPLQRRDLLYLTGLTTLHTLKISCTSGLDDVAAVALANSLAGLSALHFSSPCIASLGLLPVLGTLKHLHCLYLDGGDDFVVSDEELQLLTGLTQLTHLGLVGHECTDAGTEQYLAGIPGLERVWEGKWAGRP